jgi:hypothetical protein
MEMPGLGMVKGSKGVEGEAGSKDIRGRHERTLEFIFFFCGDVNYFDAVIATDPNSLATSFHLSHRSFPTTHVPLRPVPIRNHLQVRIQPQAYEY